MHQLVSVYLFSKKTKTNNEPILLRHTVSHCSSIDFSSWIKIANQLALLSCSYRFIIITLFFSWFLKLLKIHLLILLIKMRYSISAVN